MTRYASRSTRPLPSTRGSSRRAVSRPSRTGWQRPDSRRAARVVDAEQLARIGSSSTDGAIRDFHMRIGQNPVWLGHAYWSCRNRRMRASCSRLRASRNPGRREGAARRCVRRGGTVWSIRLSVGSSWRSTFPSLVVGDSPRARRSVRASSSLIGRPWPVDALHFAATRRTVWFGEEHAEALTLLLHRRPGATTCPLSHRVPGDAGGTKTRPRGVVDGSPQPAAVLMHQQVASISIPRDRRARSFDGSPAP